MPSSRHVRMTRTAISPRFAIRIFDSNAAPSAASNVRVVEPAAQARAAVSYGPWRDAASSRSDARLDGTRFGDVRRFARSTRRTATSSTRPRTARADGLVAVADHQTQRPGPTRPHRGVAPPGSSLLVVGAAAAARSRAERRRTCVTMAAGLAADRRRARGRRLRRRAQVAQRPRGRTTASSPGILAETRRRRRGRRRHGLQRALAVVPRRARRRPRRRATCAATGGRSATPCSVGVARGPSTPGSTGSTRVVADVRAPLGDARPAACASRLGTVSSTADAIALDAPTVTSSSATTPVSERIVTAGDVVHLRRALSERSKDRQGSRSRATSAANAAARRFASRARAPPAARARRRARSAAPRASST